MRSSPSAIDRLFAGAAGFAHRGLHGPDTPENSMAAFRGALDADVGIECDLRLSRDGFPMLFHDSSLKRLCRLDVQTESLHAATLMECTLGTSDECIPWLGDLLHLVAGRVPLLLELKTAAGQAPPPVNHLCRAVAASLARYRGPVGVMSFDPRVGQWFARNAPAFPRGLVLTGTERGWRRHAALLFSGTQFAAVNQVAVAEPWAQRLRRRMPLACWTIRDPGTLARVANRIDAPIWEGDGRP
jgi:glycerophosphoryl diester phosphodiesterase